MKLNAGGGRIFSISHSARIIGDRGVTNASSTIRRDAGLSKRARYLFIVLDVMSRMLFFHGSEVLFNRVR
jgi:hypothetical protein